jgi:prolycopene isomerase
MYWNSFHRGGFYYFRGGSQSVANALAQVVAENGGEVMLGTLATEIVIKNGRAAGVKTAGGQQYSCRYVVSNVNAPDTFETLIGYEHLPARFIERLERFRIGISWFQVYLGVTHDYQSAFPAGTHEIIVNETCDQAQNFRWFRQGVPEKVPFFIMNYTIPDNGTAPEGKNVIVLSTCMPYDWKNDWYEYEDYAKYTALKHEVADVLIGRAEDYLPGLSSRIEVIEVGSPRTMEHYTLNPGGAILGWEHTPDQVFFSRLAQQTPISNVLLAGAWTFPCGGQSAVLESGRFAAENILRRIKPLQSLR